MAKTIVITGAGDGLGRALARRFAKDGDTIVLLGRTLSKVQAVADELGGANFAIECDVSNPDSVRGAFAQIAKSHPKIDVLINNAGVFEPAALHETSDRLLFSMLNINLAGPILCAREALPLLRGGGQIINVTSEGVALKMPMLSLYVGTKTALEAMSDMWDRELAAEGIRVTVVRAGQMFDETKTSPAWDPDVAMRFVMETAKVGLNLRERPISHYNSVAEAFRAVIDLPADVHAGTVTLSGARR